MTSSSKTEGENGKKTEAKLELLTDIDLLLMFEMGIKGEIRHTLNIGM